MDLGVRVLVLYGRLIFLSGEKSCCQEKKMAGIEVRFCFSLLSL